MELHCNLNREFEKALNEEIDNIILQNQLEELEEDLAEIVNETFNEKNFIIL